MTGRRSNQLNYDPALGNGIIAGCGAIFKPRLDEANKRNQERYSGRERNSGDTYRIRKFGTCPRISGTCLQISIRSGQNPRRDERLTPISLHLFQRGDALFDRRVGAEELVDRAFDILERVDDIEMGGRFIGRLERLCISRNLPQGRSQSGRIAGQHRPARIGQEFPFSRDRQADKLRNNRPEDGEQKSDDDENRAGPALITASPSPASAPPEAAHDPVAEEGDDPDHDDRQRLQPDIVIFDMGHFVGDDALKFRPVHFLEKAGRDADDGIFRIAPRGEGVGRGVVDHVAFRSRHAGRDRQALDYVIQEREFLLRRRPGAADGEDNLVARIIADERDNDGNQNGEYETSLAHPGKLLKDPGEKKDKRQEKGDEEERLALVRSDLFVHGYCRPSH